MLGCPVLELLKITISKLNIEASLGDIGRETGNGQIRFRGMGHWENEKGLEILSLWQTVSTFLFSIVEFIISNAFEHVCE